MPRELQLSSDQGLATSRANLQGRVYLLSGTLPGRRSGVADIEFRWATTTFSGVLGQFDEYVGMPQQVLRGQEFAPGGGSTQPVIRIPVRNLKFGEATTLVAAIDDGIYAWENAEASLRVGYLKPGQEPGDLVEADWTFLVKDGFLGAPEAIELDGFNLLLYNRGARRNQVFRQRFAWTTDPLPPEYAGGGLLPHMQPLAMDMKDLGAVLPIVVGKPDKWYRVPTENIGTRGYTTSGLSAGATEVEFKRITDGREVLASGDQLFIHNRTPLYTINAASYDDELQLVTLTLASGLAVDVPRGGFVQHWGNSISGGLNQTYRWTMAGHQRDAWTAQELSGNVGFLRSNGEIVVADFDRWPFLAQHQSPLTNTRAGNPFGYMADEWDIVNAETLALVLGPGTEGDPTPPCFFPVSDATQVDVATQPQFNATARLSSKLNYPTGGTGTNNALARDGNESTGASLGVGSVITLTFPSPQSPFVDTDTDTSTLHVVVQGDINFTDSTGAVTFGQATGTGGVNEAFRFTQGTAQDFNETVRCVGAGGSGGTVVEVWWEHDLSTNEASSRTQDVTLTGGAVGEILEYADVVVRIPDAAGSSGQGKCFAKRTTYASTNSSLVANDGDMPAGNRIPYPDAVMASLQSMLLGPTDGSIKDMNLPSYSAARARFVRDDVRLNFVLNEKLSSWTELEKELAIQSRCHMYYGPSGHEVVYMEASSDLSASGIVQEFRLPATPGTNAMRGAGQLLERLPASQVVNTAEAEFNLDYVTGSYENSIVARNDDSVDVFGDRRDPRTGTSYRFWAHSPHSTHPSYDALTSISGILQHYADRAAFGATRFAFDTAWLAHGVERGSPVRVVYEVGPEVYRNVICEVEEVGVSPINGDRFGVRCRAVELPARGLPAYTWVQVFDDATDEWTDELLVGEAWINRWSAF